MSRISLNKVIAVVIAATASIWPVSARADQIRIVDSGGLVRAIKIIHSAAKVVLTLQSQQAVAIKGECVATNVDGLAAEKRVTISAKGECAFAEVGGGSWQITVPSGLTWQVRIYE